MSRKNLTSSFVQLIPAGLIACLGLSSAVSADPLAGEQLKFFQSPMNGPGGVYPIGATPLATDKPSPFPGHDELSTATLNPTGAGYTGTMMADDFSDTNPLPIGHVTWWGSYMNTQPGTTVPPIQQFQISLYTDIPAVVGGNQPFSEPGQLLATETVSAGVLFPSSGTFTETPVPGTSTIPGQPGDSGLYKYNAELNWKQFTFPDAVYPNVEWLSIVALTGANSAAPVQWGWHDRDYGIADPFAPAGTETPYPYHFLDDAVQGTFAGNPAAVGGFAPQSYIPAYDGLSSSKDLAFALYTIPVPEPATLGLIGLAGMTLLGRRNRRSA